MNKIDKHIEIVRSQVDGLSSLSQVSADAILAVLAKHYAHVGISIINNAYDLEHLVFSSPDLVFLGMKFLPSDMRLGKRDPSKTWISDYLDEHGIRYTGSNQSASIFDLDKSLAKTRVQDAGLSTSPFFVATPGSHLNEKDLPLAFPLFIKPTKMGAGQGVDEFSVVRDFNQYKAKVESIYALYKVESLVEEYLNGREFSVAILSTEKANKLTAMPIELTSEPNVHGDSMLSQAVKSANCEVVVEVTNSNLKDKVCGLALDVFSALGARDYGRIDIRLDIRGKANFLEANLIPSLICGYGSFPKACLLNQSLGYEEMILRITELGFTHNTVEEHLPFKQVNTEKELKDLLLAAST